MSRTENSMSALALLDRVLTLEPSAVNVYVTSASSEERGNYEDRTVLMTGVFERGGEFFLVNYERHDRTLEGREGVPSLSTTLISRERFEELSNSSARIDTPANLMGLKQRFSGLMQRVEHFVAATKCPKCRGPLRVARKGTNLICCTNKPCVWSTILS